MGLPGPRSGCSHEGVGDSVPRQMTVQRQNPAYRPTLLLTLFFDPAFAIF